MTENPLGYEKISKLLKNFAVPSIVASLVGSIYNIVDQIFIGQGVGYLGNAATNVAYPFSTICLAIALLIGIGSASRVSLCLGRKEPKAAAKAAGNGIVLMGIFGIIYLLVGETFLSLLLKAFGATTDVFPYAKQYASITLIGMPFLIVTNGMSNLIRADGKPKYSMVCMVVGAIINTILDPIFISLLGFEVAGAGKFHRDGEYGQLVTNPPYGERLLEKREAEALYRAFGQALEDLPPKWRVLVLSSHTEFERCFGRPVDKKRKLYNGMLKCDAFLYGG